MPEKIEALFYGNPALVDALPLHPDPSYRYYWWCFGGFVPLDKRRRIKRFYMLRGNEDYKE